MGKNITVHYDGKYPCLCMGHLSIIIDGITYDFGNKLLISGGCFKLDDEYNDFKIEKGPWKLYDWPNFAKNWSDELKERILDEINSSIPWGCCGGCI